MRLIDTRTLHLHESFDSERPAYSILSHTWGKEEVTLQEWLEWEEGSPSRKAQIEAKGGFKKIENACLIARQKGYDYIWVDTNCIDKKSSAELSEAINSMFAWYETSKACLVYLEDFQAGTHTDNMSTCRWFSRGWTLQELLAPQHVEFFDAAWEYLGTKVMLCGEISRVTGIDPDTLCGRAPIRDACVARKMSWASSRKTTRSEDMAYCLIGLFDINMPLLYGEGNDAFRRLQEEIIKISTDQSILAWDWPPTLPVPYYGGNHSVSILAPFPSAFSRCDNLVRDLSDEQQAQPRHREFAMTNLGLNIALPLIQSQETYYGILKCTNERLPDVAICVPLSASVSTGTFSRHNSRDTIGVPRQYFPAQPASISIPRWSAQRYHIPSYTLPGPTLTHVHCILFPLDNPMESWIIQPYWENMEHTLDALVHENMVRCRVWTNTVTMRNREDNRLLVFIILWAPEVYWGHVCSEVYQDKLKIDGRNEIMQLMQRAVSKAPYIGETMTLCDEWALEVGFNYARVHRKGGQWLPLILHRPMNPLAISTLT